MSVTIFLERQRDGRGAAVAPEPAVHPVEGGDQHAVVGRLALAFPVAVVRSTWPVRVRGTTLVIFIPWLRIPIRTRRNFGDNLCRARCVVIFRALH